MKPCTDPQRADQVRHYRTGDVYVVDFLATDTETKDPVVVYHRRGGPHFVRSLENWRSEPAPGVPRFSYVEERT